MSLKSGTNILYWRTTGIVVGGKMVKPVLLKNIQIEGNAYLDIFRLLNYTFNTLKDYKWHFFVCSGVAYTSECFLCRPGWFSSAPGSSSCQPCPSNTFSTKGASSCTACPENHYSRKHTHVITAWRMVYHKSSDLSQYLHCYELRLCCRYNWFYPAAAVKNNK